MQGTQYASRESTLCMEHFVALQCTLAEFFGIGEGFNPLTHTDIHTQTHACPTRCPL